MHACLPAFGLGWRRMNSGCMERNACVMHGSAGLVFSVPFLRSKAAPAWIRRSVGRTTKTVHTTVAVACWRSTRKSGQNSQQSTIHPTIHSVLLRRLALVAHPILASCNMHCSIASFFLRSCVHCNPPMHASQSPFRSVGYTY